MKSNPSSLGVLKIKVWALEFILASIALLATDGAFAAAPPTMMSVAGLQHQAVHVGTDASFQVTVSGTEPLAYQWRHDGQNLPGETNRIITLRDIQPGDEGDYSVMITNLDGAVTSGSARLWVTPSASDYIKRNFTNDLRLPYWCFLPSNYDPKQSYPLICMLHGIPGDETIMTNANPAGAGYLNYPALKVFSSYRQQLSNPTIVVWPARRAGDLYVNWNDSYLQLISGLLNSLISEFNIDTNRLYICGASEGVHAAWDLIGLRPSFFAAASVPAGWQGQTNPRFLKDLPIWVWAALDDGLSSESRSLVTSLRRVGGNPIYSEFDSGGHMGGIGAGFSNPVYIDWLLAQRRILPSTQEPLLSIASPTGDSFCAIFDTTVNISGSANALGEPVTTVAWENVTNGRKGVASGTNIWSITGIPLVPNKTNLIIVTARTASWAPRYGGFTTFNDTLSVFSSPIQLSLALDGENVTLTWTGGQSPYSLQRATYLDQAYWETVFSDTTSPITIPIDRDAAYFRVSGNE